MDNLSVKWIVVEQIGAVECFAVGLVHGDHVLISFEYLNLKIYIIYNTDKWISIRVTPHQPGPDHS